MQIRLILIPKIILELSLETKLTGTVHYSCIW